MQAESLCLKSYIVYINVSTSNALVKIIGGPEVYPPARTMQNNGLPPLRNPT